METKQSQEGKHDLLPIKRITLYRSGVGAFQREGQVEGDARVALKFDQTQINDILKSLQLLDLDGGRIDSVAYASNDPLARRLNSFSVPIADNPSLSALLTRLRGAKVTLAATEGEFAGIVLGVETRKVLAGTGKDVPPVDAPFVTLVTDKGIQAVNIHGIASLQIADKTLAEELNKALLAVSDARADRVKTVDLSLSGSGQRRLVVRYVQETPVWKTSYRLIIGSPSPNGEKLSLQGWAIVENTTDTDWKEVKLSLVSGRPVSFQMDLSEPMYLARPAIPVPTIPGVMPKNYFAGIARGGGPAAGGAAPKIAAAAAPAALKKQRFAEPGVCYAVSPDITEEQLVDAAPPSQAAAGEIGEVFFFEVQNPITIERQRSAMIPFLSEQISGRRVSIYNQMDRPDHPMRGVELINSSTSQLLPGPISVFDETAYAGDATINQVSPGDKRLLAYAVDLDVVATNKPEHNLDITHLKIVNGVFLQTAKQRFSTFYSFANKDLKRPRLIIVEHGKTHRCTLTAPEQAADSTQNLYRFELTVEPGQTADLMVCEEVTDTQRMGLEVLGMDDLVQWRTDGVASANVVQAATELTRRRQAITQGERLVAEYDKQIEINTKEQSRISEIMQRLPQTGEVYNDYTRELKEINAALKPLRTSRKEVFDKIEINRRELNEHIAGLNVE